MTRKLTVGSLFAGIGGFDLAAERAGMEVKWQVEIDPFAANVLERHWPGVKRYGDITGIDWASVEPVDIVCGGFPCQPVSQGGLRFAQDDERWLWPEFKRCVSHLRPRYVLVENVSGLLDRGMGDVLGGLAEVGYDAEWHCLPAASFGAPHIRNRVWILAYPGREPWDDEAVEGGTGRPVVLPQGDDWSKAERREDRELIALVPGVHQGMAENWWRTQSRMDRSAHGLSDGMDRRKGLGNSIVPQVAEWIFRRIQAAEALEA